MSGEPRLVGRLAAEAQIAVWPHDTGGVRDCAEPAVGVQAGIGDHLDSRRACRRRVRDHEDGRGDPRREPLA